MENFFKDKTDRELKELYIQYKEWNKTGIILPDTALDEARIYYVGNTTGTWSVLLTIQLLEMIADKWIENLKSDDQKYKYKVSNSADDELEGYVNLTKEEAKIVQYATNPENWEIIKNGKYGGVFDIYINNPIEI